ncbi:MAG: hypothetical protein LBP59_08405 [Planctomycetaceae bacterium]|nr:hypothetical protein [Planctomycetaceae bacterium]
MYSTADERGYIATVFWFAYRQIAGETPAILISFLLQKNCPYCPTCP